MKTVGLTLSSCIAIFGIAAFSPNAALAYQPPGASPPPAKGPQHVTPAPVAAPKIPVPLILRPPPVLTPDQGPNPSASRR
jgi:hypothetical protein